MNVCGATLGLLKSLFDVADKETSKMARISNKSY
jgi:hypothetical protein